MLFLSFVFVFVGGSVTLVDDNKVNPLDYVDVKGSVSPYFSMKIKLTDQASFKKFKTQQQVSK